MTRAAFGMTGKRGKERDMSRTREKTGAGRRVRVSVWLDADEVAALCAARCEPKPATAAAQALRAVLRDARKEGAA